jgi:mono/diheme cytochrome c family protein
MNILNITKHSVSRQAIAFLTLFLFFGISGLRSQSDVEAGEKLFKSYCASCHAPGNNVLVGPGLAGVYDKYEREWLYEWIKNSTALIESGDAQAVAVYEQYNKVLMPAQPVNNEEIDQILAYIQDYNENAPAEETAVAAVTEEGAAPAEEQGTSPWLILIIVVALIVVISVLRKVQYSLSLVEAKKSGSEPAEPQSMFQGILNWGNRNKRIVGLLGIVLIALVAKAGWDAALGVGVYTGYEPEQPIKFSHELHAGTNGIDCQYCHSSASYSKSAGIPSANLCMNCHTYIQEGPQYGKEEIGKIYAALDFDPVTKTYGPNTKPIKWVKVHNLPDHVYFNHSQHVTVGKIDCQKCHGPVETYTVGKQHAPLTMGWCINCHRETKVQMDGNGYYDEIHARLPEELKEEYLENGTITVSELGGIECAKCHY